MNAETIFGGLRSLRSVADDVIETLVDKVDDVLDAFEDFVDQWEQNYEDVKSEQNGPVEDKVPTRTDKVNAIWEHLQKNSPWASKAWNPTHPENKDIPDGTVDYAYDSWVKGDYSKNFSDYNY